MLHPKDITSQQDAPAGPFAAWLERTRAAERNGRDMDVPCGTCTACCTASYFIHIAPHESETLRRIPEALLFPAPGWPKGHVVMGYDESGRCPMLVDGACSIYAHRPATCRRFDCRVFPAAGLQAGGDEKGLVNARIRHWKFSYPTDRDGAAQAAVRAAAEFLQLHADRFPDGVVPRNPTQLAMRAIMVYDVFLEQSSPATDVDTTVHAIIATLRRLERATSDVVSSA